MDIGIIIRMAFITVWLAAVGIALASFATNVNDTATALIEFEPSSLVRQQPVR
jgi:hypothetical protein